MHISVIFEIKCIFHIFFKYLIWIFLIAGKNLLKWLFDIWIVQRQAWKNKIKKKKNINNSWRNKNIFNEKFCGFLSKINVL